MVLPTWLSPIARKTRSPRKAAKPRRIRARDLSVEFLEDRLVPTTFTVGAGLVGLNKFTTIQAAINAANPAGGDIIKVNPGTYAEAININKPVSLRGAEVGNDANTRFGAFTAGANGPKADPTVESIITSPINTLTNLVSVTSDGVTIDGFVIDGNNPILAPSGTQVGGINVDAAEGIINQDSGLNDKAINSLIVKNDIVQNFSSDSIEIANAPSNQIGAITTGSLFQGNVVRNFNYDGIGLSNNFYGDVKNNTVNINAGDIYAGIDIQNYNTGAGLLTVSGNTVTVGQDSLGIFGNLFYAPGFSLTIKNNTIQASAGVTGTDDLTWGVAIFSVQNTSQVTEQADAIGTSGGQFGRGVYVWNAGTDLVTLKSLAIGSNSVAPVIGIELQDVDQFYGGAPGETVALTNNTITAGTYGVAVLADVQPVDPGSGPNTVLGSIEADISGGTITGGTADVYVHAPGASSPYTAGVSLSSMAALTGGAIGLELDGAQAIAVGNTLDKTQFSLQTGDYITLANGAEFGQTINGTSASYDGIEGKNATPAQGVAIESKITDALDDPTLGFVRISPNTVFATPGTGIQAAIDAASPGDTIYIGPGTYSGSVDVNKKNLTLVGIGAVDITGPITLDDDTTFASQGALDFSGGIDLNGFDLGLTAVGANTITVDTAPITGAGGIDINNGGATGTVAFDTANTYVGDTDVEGGELDLDAASPNAIPGNLVIDAGTVKLLASEQIVDSADVTINAGATFNLNGQTETIDPLTFNGGTTDLAGGDLILAGDVVTGGLATTSNIVDTVGGGDLDLGGATRNFTVAAPDTLVVSVPIVGTGGLTAEGAGILEFNATSPNTYSGLTTVSGGSLYLAATGTPSVPNDLLIQTGGLVSMQADNQTSSTGNVTVDLGGTFNVGFIPGPGVTDTVGSLTLDGGLVQIGTGGDLILNGNVQASGVATISTIQGTGVLDLGGATRSFTVDSGDELDISVEITGTGGLTADGAGTVVLDAPVANTYNGLTTASGGGTLVLNSAGDAVPGDLTATGAGTVVSVLADEQIADSSNVEIDDGATLNIGFIPGPGTNETIATLDLTGGTVQVGDGGSLTVTSSGLNGDLAGVVNLGNSATLTVNGAGAYAGAIDGTGTFDSQGPGVQILTGTVASTVQVIVSGGELQDDGVINGPVTVQGGATLGGSGSVAGPVTILGGGTIDPGPAGGGTGILTTSGGVTYSPVTPTSTFHVDLEGTTPGTGYDQMQASGQVVVLNGAQLQINGAFCAPNGTQFVIIAGASGITGNFKFGAITLTEGMKFDLGGNTLFKITYVGGATHHDVILTRVFVIDIWTGASKTSNNWSDPMNWAKHTIPAAGDLLQFSTTGLRKFNVNDLPAGFSVGEIDFLGGGYHISGNAIVLGSGFENIGAPSLNVVSFDVTLNCSANWNNTGAAFIDSGNIDLGTFRLFINDVSAATTTKLSGAISGTGGVTKIGQGTLIFAGASSNTYTDVTNVVTGTLSLQKTNPAIAVPGDLVIGTGVGHVQPTVATVAITFDNQIADTAPITINRNGFLNFGTSSDKVGTLIFNGGKINVGAISGVIALTGDIIANVDTTIANKIDLGSTAHTFFAPQGVTLTLASQIFGTGASLELAGDGKFVMSGNTENLYTGTTTVDSGTLLLSKSAGAISIFGPLVIGDGVDAATVRYTAANQIKDNQPITVNAGSKLAMDGFSDQVGALTLNDGTISIGAGTLTINGDITVTGSSTIVGGTLYIKEVSRTVDVVGPTDRLDLFANVTSIFNAGLIKTGDGTLALHGSTFAGPVTVTTGRVVVGSTATIGSATVSDTGRLTVRGTVTGSVTLAPNGVLSLRGGTILGAINTTGGTIRGTGTINGGSFTGVTINPGTASTVGTITTTSDLTLDPTSTFDAKVGLVAAVLVSDQLVQTGGSQGIDLNNSNLNVSLLSGYVPTVGDTFTLVSSPVLGILGQFANAPDGTILTIGANQFEVDYVLDPSMTFVTSITLTCVA